MSTAELTEYMDRIFFRGPLWDEELPSLVYEDPSGRVTGFLGVISRRMRLAGRSIRVAVGTQLMVTPGASGLPGLQLARALVNGPQDITLSDTANDSARVLWHRIGGYTVAPYSLFWARPLRPLRYALTRRMHGILVRALILAARPLCAVIDRWLSRRDEARMPTVPLGDRSESLDCARQFGDLERILDTWALRPEYTPAALQWLLAEVGAKRHHGHLEQVLIRDRQGTAVGWFIYFSNPGGVGQVIQVACRATDYERLLAHLFHHGRRRGSVALSGRLDPAAMQALVAHGCEFSREGPWMMAHSRRTDVLDAIDRGGAFLSRLEGEWWLSF
ncbi:MAG: hypothetical protein ACREL2_06235 [Gemmatimonadales bacterium]